MIVIDVMEEHVDAAEVVRGQVYLLPEKPDAYIFLAENFCEL